MHLTIVSPFPPAITGIGQYGYHITRALANSGSFSHITVLAGSDINTERPNHLSPTEIEYCWAPGQFDAWQSILSRIKQLNPDLVWFNLRMGMFGESTWLSTSNLITPMLVRKMGFPTVVTLHEMMELSDLRTLKAPGGILAPLGASLITNIVTQADVVCLTMKKHLDWFAKKRPRVDCINIPLGAYHEPVLLDEHHKTELLMFNMLAPFKGAELLLEVFPSLKLEYPDLELTIAGREHPRFPGYVQSIKKRFNGMKGIKWLGQIAEENVIDLFRSTQVVVLPYKATTGASSVLFQAAAYGRPVVASNLSELRALAQESNIQVELFENDNAESLRNAIRALLNSPSRRLAQAENNFRSAQNMRLDITCHLYLRAFNRALEKRQSQKRISIPLTEMESS
jgi:glycosyltransferase involved in cell wall biosynthesis